MEEVLPLSCQVIVPTNDAIRPLRRAVESVLTDPRAGAVIVAHNISSDRLDIPIDPRVQVVELEGAYGMPGAAFDRGIEVATAPWVGIMGSDDWFEPGATQAMVFRAEQDEADGVLAPLAYQRGARGFLPRTTANRDLKAVEDRMFYRTAPLGLYRRKIMQSPEFAFGDTYPVGSDIRIGSRLWTSDFSISYYPHDPAYVVGSDASVRTTTTRRPLAVQGRAWLDLWDEPWVESLDDRTRRALAVKMLRVHVHGEVLKRPRMDDWEHKDFEWLSAYVKRLEHEVPGAIGILRLPTARTLNALLNGDLEGTVVACEAEDSAKRLYKLLPQAPWALLAREAPIRTNAIGYLEHAKMVISRRRQRPAQMTGRYSLLILSFSPIVDDARVMRQVNLFKDEFNVVTAGFGPAPEGVYFHIELDRTLLPTDLDGRLISLKQYRLAYWVIPAVCDAWERLRGVQVDCILADDIEALPIAVRLRPKCGILADFHEHYPSMHEYSPAWKRRISPYYSWLIRSYGPRADFITTVSRGLQRGYEAQFDFRPEVIVNATPYADLAPVPVAEPIKLVHSGACQRKRHLEIMLEAVQDSNANVTLDLFITPNDPAYLQELKDRYSADPRVTFNDPVPYADLIPTLNKFDVGVFVLPPATFSYKWALPNKFFDFIQARLGIVVGPSPEMASIVKELGNGEVSEGFDPASLQLVLEELTIEKVAKWKASSNDAARDMGADRQSAGWVDAVQAILTECDPSSNTRLES